MVDGAVGCSEGVRHRRGGRTEGRSLLNREFGLAGPQPSVLMGLDLVDIALGIEERLGVRLPHDFGSRSRTVADLVSEIAKAIPLSREHHVELVRQALLKSVGQEVQESTPLATLVPIATRRKR